MRPRHLLLLHLRFRLQRRKRSSHNPTFRGRLESDYLDMSFCWLCFSGLWRSRETFWASQGETYTELKDGNLMMTEHLFNRSRKSPTRASLRRPRKLISVASNWRYFGQLELWCHVSQLHSYDRKVKIELIRILSWIVSGWMLCRYVFRLSGMHSRTKVSYLTRCSLQSHHLHIPLLCRVSHAAPRITVDWRRAWGEKGMRWR